MSNHVDAEPVKRLCDYCEGPMSADSSRLPATESNRQKAYCCYGCRLLGERGARPLGDFSAPLSGWFKILVGAVIAGQAMLLGLAVNLDPPEGVTRWLFHLALLASAISVMAILGKPLWTAVVEAWRRKKITIEFLFFSGIIGALAASMYSTLTRTGAIYYEIVALLLTVYAAGKTLGAQSRAKALAEARKLNDVFACCQQLMADGSTESVPAARIQPGDQVRVAAGEPIPVDGRIMAGRALVTETPLTGELFPVARRIGDEVLAGSFSEDGLLIIQATRPGNQRRLDAVLELVEAARELPSASQTQADKVVQWFLPVVWLTALAAFGYWFLHDGFATGLFNALAVLLVACPCAMGLATPIALWHGMARLAAHGLVAASADFLDRLAETTLLVFDKTGTLSEERASLIDWVTAGAEPERQELMAMMQAVQLHSRHPVAAAFASWPKISANPWQVRSRKTVPAGGVESWLAAATGQEACLRMGSRDFMTDLTGEKYLLHDLFFNELDQLVYIERDGHLCAIAAVRERLRATVDEALHALKALGIEYAVLTGDQPERARSLGLSRVEGKLTPAQKVERLKRWRADGHKPGFVGDGVNDAPAMNAAWVGIALAHGVGITTATAQAVLHGGDLRVLPWAIALARQIKATLRSNLIFAAAYNLLGIGLAATGHLHPVTAAVLMVLSSFTVAWRALRSTDSAGCCLPAVPSFLSRPGRKPAHPATLGFAGWWNLESIRTWRHRIYGLLFILQVPFLSYLGGLSTPAAAWLAAVHLGLGVGMAGYRPRHPEQIRLAAMTFGMLAVGNWGMLLGWWADAGFQPVTGGCCQCPGSISFGLSSIINAPAMNLGMLALGLPLMLLDERGLSGWPIRGLVGLLSALGMVLGMNRGNALFLNWLAPDSSMAFLVSYAGMTTGMLLGMLFFCELGRALALYLRNRPSRVRTPPACPIPPRDWRAIGRKRWRTGRCGP